MEKNKRKCWVSPAKQAIEAAEKVYKDNFDLNTYNDYKNQAKPHSEKYSIYNQFFAKEASDYNYPVGVITLKFTVAMNDTQECESVIYTSNGDKIRGIIYSKKEAAMLDLFENVYGVAISHGGRMADRPFDNQPEWRKNYNNAATDAYTVTITGKPSFKLVSIVENKYL